MLRFLLPAVLALVGLGAGVGAGWFLRPAADAATDAHAAPAADAHGAAPAADAHGAAPAADAHGEAPADEAHGAEAGTGPEYVKLTNQFVVPVLSGGKVVSMVILSLNLEVTAGGSEEIYSKEPKLRDAFLQVMFDHANAGGFAGSFTDGANLVLLRRALLEAGVSAIGDVLTDVLIVDIVRQDS